jgi:hypothetical protein
MLLDQFMPDCNLQATFDVSRNLVPIHVSVAILSDPQNKRQLVDIFSNKRKIQGASFSDENIRPCVL